MKQLALAAAGTALGYFTGRCWQAWYKPIYRDGG